MTDAEKKFVDFANPHCWLITADNLHEQAVRLHSHHGQSIITRFEVDGGQKSWDGVNRSVFLLGGFALENAIKAFLVYENPSWVSNGRLSKDLRSHSLTLLQQKSKLIPYKKRY